MFNGWEEDLLMWLWCETFWGFDWAIWRSWFCWNVSHPLSSSSSFIILVQDLHPQPHIILHPQVWSRVFPWFASPLNLWTISRTSSFFLYKVCCAPGELGTFRLHLVMNTKTNFYSNLAMMLPIISFGRKIKGPKTEQGNLLNLSLLNTNWRRS